jgi:hypothetical protein
LKQLPNFHEKWYEHYAITAHPNAIPLLYSICNKIKGDPQTCEVGETLAPPEFRALKLCMIIVLEKPAHFLK